MRYRPKRQTQLELFRTPKPHSGNSKGKPFILASTSGDQLYASSTRSAVLGPIRVREKWSSPGAVLGVTDKPLGDVADENFGFIKSCGYI